MYPTPLLPPFKYPHPSTLLFLVPKHQTNNHQIIPHKHKLDRSLSIITRTRSAIIQEKNCKKNQSSKELDSDMKESNMAWRLWHVVRAVLFMLRKGMPKRKLAMDLHLLLLQRGKIAGKALCKIMTTAHGHHHHQNNSSDASTAAEEKPQPPFSCRALDPAFAVYDPLGAGREVEFSCSNTPSYPSFHFNLPTNRRRRNNNHGGRRGGGRGANGGETGWYNYDAADIALAFKILNNSDQLFVDDAAAHAAPLAVAATPSPALGWHSFGRSPAPVRQLRITDSPFPLRNDDAATGDGGLVDLEAEEFIKKFYEQLRTQQSLAAATPDYYGGCSRPVTGVAY